MEPKHTPWHYKQLIGTTDRGWALFYTHSYGTKRVDDAGEFTEANASRIAQCVNACEGIENPGEAIAAARDAVYQANCILGGIVSVCVLDESVSNGLILVLDRARSALAMLTPSAALGAAQASNGGGK